MNQRYQFDEKGFRFVVFFVCICVLLVLLIKIGSNIGFNSYFSKQIPIVPTGLGRVSATEYEVMDIQSGKVIAERNPYATKPIASITKLMTALVALQTLDLGAKTAVSAQAAAAYQETDFQIGAKWTTSDLLYPLLMESSNDAASVLAETYPSSENPTTNSIPAKQAYAETAFVEAMNRQAISIGMKNTSFDEPSGISYGNVSNANDLLKLTSYILKNQPVIFELTATKDKTVTTSEGMLNFNNINIFADDPNFIGGKVGYTPAAGETMLVVFRIPKGTEAGHTVGIVILGSNNRTQDINNILAWLE
jgi:D-alanyl-D-alanine endopeptidase (penicillin-binding protein 7)